MADTTSDVMDLGDDDGFVTVRVRGDEVRVDLFEAFNRLKAHYDAHKGQPAAEYNAGTIGIMSELGLPPVSQKMAVQFVTEVYERIGDVKKNSSPAPDSPASTAPPS